MVRALMPHVGFDIWYQAGQTQTMGAWGYLPWDNDSAADWYGDLLDETKVADKVEATLKLDVTDHYEEIRAAAGMVVMLGQVYIWPIDKLDAHLALAASKLEEILTLGEIQESPELTETIRGEIQELRSRIKTPEKGSSPPKPPSTKWWQFWK